MILESHVPAPPLDSFVEFLWFYDDFQPQHTKEKLLPDGSMELILDLREHPKRLFDRADFSRFTEYRRAWLSGAQREYLVIDASPGSMMGAHFRPGGAWPFFAAPLSEFAGQVVPMESVVGRGIETLRERLLEAATIPERFRLLEEFLLALAGDRLRADPLLGYAMQQMVSAPVRLLVRELAGKVGVSHKHLIHMFEQRVGITPKQMGRLGRFQQVLQNVSRTRPDEVDWAAVALDCGYYDQSHFIHDFQAFAGMTPTAFLEMSRYSTNFLILDPPPSLTPQPALEPPAGVV